MVAHNALTSKNPIVNSLSNDAMSFAMMPNAPHTPIPQTYAAGIAAAKRGFQRAFTPRMRPLKLPPGMLGKRAETLGVSAASPVPTESTKPETIGFDSRVLDEAHGKALVKKALELKLEDLEFIHKSPYLNKTLKPVSYKNVAKDRSQSYMLKRRKTEEKYRKLLGQETRKKSYLYATIPEYSKMRKAEDYPGYSHYFKLPPKKMEQALFEIANPGGGKGMKPMKGRAGLAKAIKHWEKHKDSYKTLEWEGSKYHPRIEVILPMSVKSQSYIPQIEDRKTSDRTYLGKKSLKKIASKKYRDRVEVFGRSEDGKILGGIYSGDRSFGTYGGGVDNDTILQAGKREYKEESGWTLKNVKKLPGKPLVLPWDFKDVMLEGNQIRRLKKYPDGNRTFYLVGDLHRKGKQASGEDGESGLLKQRLYSKKEIEKLLAPKSRYSEVQQKRVKSRLNALKKIASKNLKVRHRVEAFGLKNGKIYGGIYQDGQFGTFGGGLGNNTPEQAAREEYQEEGGYILENVRKIPMPPAHYVWGKADRAQAHRTGKQGRIKQFPDGMMTQYLVGDIVKKVKKAKGIEHDTGLKKMKFYTPDQALSHLPPVDKRTRIRRKVIEYIREQHGKK